MKKIAVLLVLAALLLGACGSKSSGDSAAAVNLAGSIIPEGASIVGTADVPGLLKLDFAKKMSKETAEFEKQLGIKAQDLGVMTFWATVAGKNNTDAAFFTKGIPISVIEKLGGKNETYQGIKLYTLGDQDSVAAEIAGYVVFGTVKAVKASADASKGKNLASSGRDKEFSSLLGKTSGLVAFAFVPDATMKKDIDSSSKGAGQMADFVKNFKGLAFGLGYASKNFEVRAAAASTGDAAKKAADYISQMKEGFKGQIDMYSMMLGKEAAGAAKKAFDSFKAKASGDFLNLDIDVPEILVDAIVSKFAGMFSGMAGSMVE